jgi:iron complex outermembrane receptor protein
MRPLLLLVASFCAMPAFSQTAIDLDPINITSARTALKVSETGRSITVIDSKTMAALRINSLDEILRYFGSVEVQQRGPAGAQADIVIRGGTFQQVLVLLDGVKINDPVTGHFNAYIPIIPAQIDHIEILKGPAAAGYGTEAVGGVINVITKTFTPKNFEESTHGSATVEVGEYGYLSAQANFEKASEKIKYALGALSNNAKGQLLRGNNRGYFHNNTFSGSVAFAFTNNWRLMLQSSYDMRDFAAQNYYTTFVSDTAVETVRSFWNHAKLAQLKNGRSNEFDAVVKQGSDYYLYNPKSIANENKGKLFSFQFIHGYQVSKFLFYNYGVQTELKSIRSNDRGNHTNGSVAGFSSALIKVSQLTINPGLRIVNDENYGLQLLPQANFAMRVQKFSFKLNAGRAIRSADFTERYNNYNKTLVTGGSIGNPNLTAVKSWSYEAGADFFAANFKFGAAFFIRSQDDVIDYVPTPYSQMPRKDNLSPTGTYALSKNIKKITTNGLELEANYRKQFSATSNIYLSASATFLHSASSDSIPSFYIISHAKTLIQGSLVFNHRGLGLSITSIFKERLLRESPAIKSRVAPQYWIVNSKLSYAYKMAALFVSINNIGNIDYIDLLGSKMPGRWVTGGISFTF